MRMSRTDCIPEEWSVTMRTGKHLGTGRANLPSPAAP